MRGDIRLIGGDPPVPPTRENPDPLNVYSPSAIIGFSLLNSILMARFLKQSFAQTCLKETDNGKLHQFNY